ncbi:hypothetical protein [Desulfosporosinus sp. BICA1-9]|uniref:hypothetical protein n=1 Tax=Desulfosporosinus sp. BICA1-9 TaxID=1531958 RepID=UPI00054AFD9F|nr:hypothetical protein [Desulfosporosinus sp. BICA1-9]KJS46969.1 MAG: hypothetical protein VR66_22355 [Peptococcaceae bacterium BRH_c23]KJS87642.1 MAG: hypothetical protein JL57_13550 [Desulfosporosinus sp. BICA1-9]HBW33843.1 hypothetical protein [Desulfosporosinus sp.]
MNNKQIIGQLKQIYELEKFQINYYTSQISSTQNSLLDKALSKIIQTDKEHTDFFVHIFTDENIEIPKIATTIADIAGSIIGESMELTGQANTFKIGVSLEEKALSAYYELLKENDLESKLKDKLIDFKLDKEFHMLWLQHYAQYLKHRSSQKNYLLYEGIEEHPTVNLNMRWI